MIRRAAPSCLPAGRRQRGAAALMTVLFLLIVVAFAVLVSLNMSGSDVSDSAYQHNSVHALFLAESGVERASQRYGAGTACGAGLMEGAIALGSGQFEVVAPTPFVNGALCVVRVRGTIGSVARTIEAEITRDGATIVFDASNVSASTAQTNILSWSYTVGSGSNRILIVGVSIRNDARSVTSIAYGTQSLALAGNRTGTNARVQIWYLIAPNSGTNTITVNLSGNTEVVGGAVSLSGVNQSQDLATQFIGDANNNSTPSVSITPATVNAWVVDTLAFRQRGSSVADGATATVGAGQNPRWNTQSGYGNGEVGGAGSTEGPVNPAASVTMSWSLTRNDNGNSVNRDWALGAVYVRPSSQVMRWNEVVN